MATRLSFGGAVGGMDSCSVRDSIKALQIYAHKKAKMLLLDVFTTDQSFLNQMLTQQLRDLHENLSHL